MACVEVNLIEKVKEKKTIEEERVIRNAKHTDHHCFRINAGKVQVWNHWLITQLKKKKKHKKRTNRDVIIRNDFAV